MQTYGGHIEFGRFYPNKGVALPDSKEALLVIGSVTKPKNVRAEAWRNFFDKVNATDEELPETIERISFKREIDI